MQLGWQRNKLHPMVLREGMIAEKIEKELARFKKRLFYSTKAHKEIEKAQHMLNNMPYELYDKIKNDNFSVTMPIIKSADETVDKIIEDNSSMTRFGDGEFVLMTGGRIKYQRRNGELAVRLREVLASELPNLLIALPPCFGTLDHFLPPVANFLEEVGVT